MNQRTTIYAAALAGLALVVLIVSLLVRVGREAGDKEMGARASVPDALLADRRLSSGGLGQFPSDEEAGGAVEGLPYADFALRTLRVMLKAMAENPTAIRDEALLTFSSEEAYRKFLASVGSRRIRLLASSDPLRSVRVGFERYEDLAHELGGMDPSETTAGVNYLVTIPAPPATGDAPGAGAGAVPFGRDALAWLGIDGDNSAFGSGVRVAVLDSGVQAHAAFGDRQISEVNYVVDAGGQVVPIDSDNGHGTAVASIIGGSDPRLPGVAPAADLLSYRILDNSGVTDSFTLAQAIVGATDAGADVINVSLGSSGDSNVVRDAVTYAMDNGALIVAASGNEGADRVSYPAAIEGVVAVAANDARGEHLDFANAGTNLEAGGLSAPGYGVAAAWPGDQAITFSGTSASAPYVSGAVAAVMSSNPGMSSQDAYQLLLANSNEAGAPGADPIYGAGNLDVGRTLQSGTDGIVDVAVASYYYDPVLAAAGGNESTAQVVVENRGTEPVHNIVVEVDSGHGARNYNVPYLNPGDIAVLETPIDAAAGAAAGLLQVSATASLDRSLNGNDQAPTDNLLQTTIEWPTGEGEQGTQ